MLCGRKVRDFEAYRANADDGDIAYCNTLAKAYEWLSQLNMEGFGGKENLHGIINRMTDEDAECRPGALEVSETLRQCKNSGGTLFIGDCTA